MRTTPPHTKRYIVWAIVVALFLLHQDFWWWNDRSLILGFMPIGLAYQAIFSIAVGLIWALASKFAWPEEIEAWAAEQDENVGDTGGQE
jgi:hypothetical protein